MAKPRIVYVDDDFELTELVRGALDDEGFETFVAHDGEEGLELILTEQPDVVILDVMMPKLNGWEILKYLRDKDAFRDLPVLMLTGVGPALNEMTAPLYGASDHLDKPFDLDDLVERVTALASTDPAPAAAD